MCKGPNEPGGPYRCSGDMAKALASAESRFSAALAATAEPQSEKERADAMLARVDAQIEGASSPEQREVLQTARVRFAREQKNCEARYRLARASFQRAGTDLQKAQYDYDATPRGVAELQSHLDAEPDSQEHEDRLDRALERMNKEAQFRDGRWGSVTGDAMPVPLRPNENEGWKSVYSDLSRQDGLSASCVMNGYAMDDASGREGTGYTVTFYRDEPNGGSRSMRVRYLAPTGSGEPSQADVLERMSATASDYQSHRNFSAYCKSQGVDQDEREAARLDYLDGKRYARQLEGFLGPRAEDYLSTANSLRSGVGASA